MRELDLFWISQSEALVIGFALAEYEVVRRGCPQYCFVQSILARITPLLPSLIDRRECEIEAADLPADLEQSDASTSWSPSTPDSCYRRESDGDGAETWYRIDIDATRKNLADLLFQLLRDGLGLAKSDDTRFADTHGATYAQRWSQSLSGLPTGATPAEALEWLKRSVRPSAENEQSDLIAERLSRLVEHNQVQRAFAAGRNFGLLSCHYNGHLALDGGWWLDDPADWRRSAIQRLARDDANEAITRLLEDRMINEVAPAADLLRSLHRGSSCYELFLAELECPDADGVTVEGARLVQSTWCAFGMILGHLRQIEGSYCQILWMGIVG